MPASLIPKDDFSQITQLITAEWGDGMVAQLAEHLARTQPGLRGFTSRVTAAAQ